MESLRSCPTEEPQTPGSSSVYQDGQGQGGQDLSVPSVYLDLSLVYGTVYFPHRLDYATSGLLIVCLDKRCVASFGSAFAKKLIEKEYSAVIKGHVDWGRQLGRTGLPSTSIAPACDTEKGPILDMLYDPLSPLYKIESYTKKDEQHPIGMRTAEPGEENAKALKKSTLFGTDVTLVRLYPLTGRTHQLRVHMAAIGHAIVGDYTYDRRSTLEEFKSANRMMLHAKTLMFPLHLAKGPPVSSRVSADCTVSSGDGYFRISTECPFESLLE